MPGFIGSCSYSQRNLFGLNQKLTAALEAGQSDSTFRISHTDPWVRGDPHRTSRTISLQSAKTSGECCIPLYTCHIQVTDNPGTSVQPSWLAEDVNSSLS